MPLVTPTKLDVFGAILKAQPEGKVMWIAVRGSSMRPVLVGGENLKVVRCSAAQLEAGQIAVLLRADGVLVAHLVVGTRPVRTASFAGTVDPPGLEVLARAVTVRRGSVEVPMTPLARLALLGLQRVWSLASLARPTRLAYAGVRAAVAWELTAPARRLLGPVEVQLLSFDSLKDFAIGLSRWETLSGQALERLLRAGVVVGAKRQGRWVGFVCVSADQVVRHAFLQRRAQGMGLEVQMTQRLVREAEARGLTPVGFKVHSSQPGFVAALKALGLLAQSTPE